VRKKKKHTLKNTFKDDTSLGDAVGLDEARCGAVVLTVLLLSPPGLSSSCSTTAVGTVVLNDCPLSEHRFVDGQVLSVTYEAFTWNLPGVVVTTRAFRMGAFPASIPVGLWVFPKGVDAQVLYTNTIGGGHFTNLHTHGLHVHGGFIYILCGS
jgi:hypothetical protein